MSTRTHESSAAWIQQQLCWVIAIMLCMLYHVAGAPGNKISELSIPFCREGR